MNSYFFKMTNEERSNILDQHKTVYDGFATQYGQPKEQPLYVQDFANDKGGITVSNKGNVKGYNAIKNYEEWKEDENILREKLRLSGVGLHNNRTKYIWSFKDKFWANPKDFYFTSKKYHIKKRDSILSKVKGIALAKVSFALEMIHPNEARVLCGDIHQLRLYDMEHLKYNKSRSGTDQYKKMERHWSVNCGKAGVPSYIARSIYWDNLQKKEDSRYWSYVLE